jgi:hypothetical protein
MKKARLISLPAVILLFPAICFAHGFNPFLYALGPFPLYGFGSLFIALAIPITVLVETLVLWAWVRRPGLPGNLWRASIFYIAARIAETAALIFLSFGPFHGWAQSGGSIGENFAGLALCLITGLGVKLAIAYGLYARDNLSTGRMIAALSTATIAGYIASLGWIHLAVSILYR